RQSFSSCLTSYPVRECVRLVCSSLVASGQQSLLFPAAASRGIAYRPSLLHPALRFVHTAAIEEALVSAICTSYGCHKFILFYNNIRTRYQTNGDQKKPMKSMRKNALLQYLPSVALLLSALVALWQSYRAHCAVRETHPP